MAQWLLKTEPSEYSFADLQRDGKTAWTGITSAAALIHMRSARKGDEALIYHTGDEKRIVGLAQIASDPYPDPKAGDPKLVAFDIKPVRALAKVVELKAIKADPRFKEFGLVRISRLSVMPVPDAMWAALMKMAGETGSFGATAKRR